MAEALRKKVVRGVGWSLADSFMGHGITFLVGLILARLLSPEEYGLIGIIAIFIAVFNSIVDSGFSNALIRKNNATDIDYNTMFFVNMACSVFLFGIMYLIAPLIASFFERPELEKICKVMGIILVLNAFAIVQNTILTKQIDFKTKAKASFISSLSSGVIGIIMAYLNYGVWALVGQQISRQMINSICLWLFNKWRPSFLFSFDSFREMWNFGWKLLASSLLNTAWNEVYQVVIGKCYSPAILGLYTRAQQFANICSTNLTSIVQRVSYPALSKLQDDREKLKQAYKKVIKITMFVSFSLMLGMAGCSKSLIIVLIGEKWAECVPYLQLVCLNMMLYPLHAINLNMLQVQGRSDLFFRLEVIKKVLAVGPILLGVFINIYWMLAGSVVLSFICFYLNAYYTGPFLSYSIKEQVLDVLPSFIIAFIMGCLLYIVDMLKISSFVILPMQIVLGLFIIVIISEIRKQEEYLETKQLLYNFVQVFLNKR